MQLYGGQSYLVHRGVDDISGFVNEYPHPLNFFRKLAGNLTRLRERDATLAGGKDKTQRVRAGCNRRQSVFKGSGPADFDPGMHAILLGNLRRPYWTVPRQLEDAVMEGEYHPASCNSCCNFWPGSSARMSASPIRKAW